MWNSLAPYTVIQQIRNDYNYGKINTGIYTGYIYLFVRITLSRGQVAIQFMHTEAVNKFVMYRDQDVESYPYTKCC